MPPRPLGRTRPRRKISKAKQQIDGLAELNDDLQEQNAVLLKAINDLKQPNGRLPKGEAVADATA